MHCKQSLSTRKLDTFIGTRGESTSEREATIVINALYSLFEMKVHPYTRAGSFLPNSPVLAHRMRWFLDRISADHPSLYPVTRRVRMLAVLRCTQAQLVSCKDRSLFAWIPWPIPSIHQFPAHLTATENLPYLCEILLALDVEIINSSRLAFAQHKRELGDDQVAAELSRVTVRIQPGSQVQAVP
ncbi:hypothetical protein C8J56DRAFT_279345 [Mycena floridula]|nr:hypothetical protein C8J56DRAFT_279345 [Mycena floridula]